ncbi:MAG: flagellin [Hyphomicrobiales bacterium]
MSEINLSSAVRTSLVSLQSTAELLNTTQERLATGNRVNSALDDPTAFFTAAALNNRANDLSTLLDAQGQAIRTVEVADDGLTAIQALVDSARAQATAALQTEDLTARATAAEAFDDILGQIQQLADDASFNGTNLLQGDDLQVIFNEDGSSSLTVEGVDFTNAATSLGLTNQTGLLVGRTDASLAVADFGGTPSAGDTITISDGTSSVSFELADADGTPGISDADIAASAAAAEANGDINLGSIGIDATTGEVTSDAGNLSVTVSDPTGAVTGAAVTGAGTGTAFVAGTGGDFADDASINAALESIDSALSTLRSSASSFGADLSTIQIRQDFTSQLINTLELGSGDLTLADLNEEGANLLTLQTRQQLASTSLSFATQADQSVLSLFG